MKDKTILYIHGFNSSGTGNKVDSLKNAGFEVIAPHLEQLDANQDLEKLLSIAEKLIAEQNSFDVVGSSLGGFYALCLSDIITNDKLNYHCINPSYEPHKTLQRHLGETLINFKTGNLYELKQVFLNSLESTFYQHVKPIKEFVGSIYFYLGTKDELLDFTEIKQRTKNIQYSEQDHGFLDISIVIKTMVFQTHSADI